MSDSTDAKMLLYPTNTPERLREIAESIVDVGTDEGRFLLKAATEVERLHRIGVRWKHNSEEWERLAREADRG
jgi:hypothetical protein